jgi:hypothetical protein
MHGYNFEEDEISMALDSKVVALLSRPNFAHIATLMPDGSPNVTPVWIGVRDNKILLGSGESSPQDP